MTAKLLLNHRSYLLRILMDTNSKKYVLLISAGGSFLAPFMVSALIVAIPSIGKDFSMDAAAMGRLATAFFLAVIKLFGCVLL